MLDCKTFLKTKNATKIYKRVSYYSIDIRCSSLTLNSLLVVQTVYIDLKLFLKQYSDSVEFSIGLYRLILKHFLELFLCQVLSSMKIVFCYFELFAYTFLFNTNHVLLLRF